MNISDKLDKLIEFIYDEYEESSVFKTHGGYAGVIVYGFTDRTGISFGDAGAQVEAIRLLTKSGWLEIVPFSRHSSSSRIISSTRIKLTIEGIRYVEGRRESWVKRHGAKLIAPFIEGITRGLRK